VLKGLRDRLLELLDAPSGRVETRGTVLDANGVLWRLAFDDKSPQTGDWKRGERAEVEGRVLDTDEPTLLVRRFFRFS
jgi:hypothetical protein